MANTCYAQWRDLDPDTPFDRHALDGLGLLPDALAFTAGQARNEKIPPTVRSVYAQTG